MTHSNQTSGVEQGAARVRHNRPIEGVLEFPLPRDIHEVWFQIFLPKKSDSTLFFLIRKAERKLFELGKR